MKKKEPDYQQMYHDSWRRWQEIHKNGCNDPFWSDGVNLNLIRNHMIYALSNSAVAPEDKLLPDQVDYDYMANPNDTRLIRMRKPDHSAGTQISIFDL